MANQPPLVMLSAGEASGDRHAAALFLALKGLLPEVEGFGMGSCALHAAGVEIVFDSSGIGVIGLAEIARHYGEIRGALTLMKKAAASRQPDLLICVDYKEFNFRLAKAAKALGIKVLFYVSPQVWAWRPGRVKRYGEIIDHMAVIFPFELPYYEAYKVPATYVGHPLAGKVKATLPRDVVRARLAAEAGFEQDKTPLIGLLPGSRANEIKRLLPVILDAAERLMDTHPTARFLLFQAASLPPDTITEALAARRLPVQVIQGQDYDLLQCADAVITVSGTATLEVALLGVPMAIVYRLAPLSYWLGRLLVKVPFIGLPNILAGRRLVREFIQHEATADNLAQEMSRILDHPAVADTIKQGLAEIRGVLGDRDGSFELALLARDMLVSNAQQDPD